MKKLTLLLTVLLLFSLLTPASLASEFASEATDTPASETTVSTLTYKVTRGSAAVEFAYPDYCWIEESSGIGVFVHLNELNYVTLEIPRRKIKGTAELSQNIGDDS